MARRTPRILVIRRRYLGDVTLLGPVFRNLRRHWPEALIAGLVDAPFVDVLALNPDVSQAWTFPTRLAAWPWFLLKVRGARFTHIFDLDNRGRSALVAWASGAAFRLVLHHAEHPVSRPRAFNHAVHVTREDYERRSICDYYLQALAAAGVPAKSRAVRLVPREKDVVATRAQLGPGPILLVHPGSRHAARIWPRIWPMDRFASVCDLVQQQLGARVVLAAGPGEQALLAEIRRYMRYEAIPFDSLLSVAQFAALARSCSLLLCHDSGPMHVAAAVGTRVVALYGSQKMRQFLPTGEGHTLMQPSLPCGLDCVAPGECVQGDSYQSFCVRRIKVEEVFAAVRAQFEQMGNLSHRACDL